MGDSLFRSSFPPLSMWRHLLYGGAWGAGVGLWLALNYFVCLVTMFLFAFWPISYRWVPLATTGPWHTFRLFWSEYAVVFEGNPHPFVPASEVALYAVVIGFLIGMLFACVSRMFLLDMGRRVTACMVWAFRSMIRNPVFWVVLCLPVVLVPVLRMLERWWIEWVFVLLCFVLLILSPFMLLRREIALGEGKERWRPVWPGWRTMGLILLVVFFPTVVEVARYVWAFLGPLVEYGVLPLSDLYLALALIVKPCLQVHESSKWVVGIVVKVLLGALFLSRARGFSDMQGVARFVLQWDVIRPFVLRDLRMVLLTVVLVTPLFIHAGAYGYIGYHVERGGPGVPSWIASGYGSVIGAINGSSMVLSVWFVLVLAIYSLLLNARLYARLGLVERRAPGRGADSSIV